MHYCQPPLGRGHGLQNSTRFKLHELVHFRASKLKVDGEVCHRVQTKCQLMLWIPTVSLIVHLTYLVKDHQTELRWKSSLTHSNTRNRSPSLGICKSTLTMDDHYHPMLSHSPITRTVLNTHTHTVIPRSTHSHSQKHTQSFPEAHTVIPRSTHSHSQKHTQSFPEAHTALRYAHGVHKILSDCAKCFCFVFTDCIQNARIDQLYIFYVTSSTCH